MLFFFNCLISMLLWMLRLDRHLLSFTCFHVIKLNLAPFYNYYVCNASIFKAYLKLSIDQGEENTFFRSTQHHNGIFKDKYLQILSQLTQSDNITCLGHQHKGMLRIQLKLEKITYWECVLLRYNQHYITFKALSFARALSLSDLPLLFQCKNSLASYMQFKKGLIFDNNKYSVKLLQPKK